LERETTAYIDMSTRTTKRLVREGGLFADVEVNPGADARQTQEPARGSFAVVRPRRDTEQNVQWGSGDRIDGEQPVG
jgi:hypothetical protein